MGEEKRITPLRAIRAKCLDCSGGSPTEVERCNPSYCPLYEYRFGHDPNLKGRKKAKDPTFAKRMAEARARKVIERNKEEQ